MSVCLFQPVSAAAKLLEGKSRRESDSDEFHNPTGKGSKDKATGTTHYGVPQLSAKTPPISALPLPSQRKQPAVITSNFHQRSKGEANNVGNTNGFHRHGQPHRLSLSSTARGHSHPSRVNSHRIKRHSESSHRHLLQVSPRHVRPPVCCCHVQSSFTARLFSILFVNKNDADTRGHSRFRVCAVIVALI